MKRSSLEMYVQFSRRPSRIHPVIAQLILHPLQQRPSRASLRPHRQTCAFALAQALHTLRRPPRYRSPLPRVRHTIFPDLPDACSYALDTSKVRIQPRLSATPPIPPPCRIQSNAPLVLATILLPLPTARTFGSCRRPRGTLTLLRRTHKAHDTHIVWPRVLHHAQHPVRLKGSVREGPFPVFVAAGPFGGNEAFVGLAFGAVDRPVGVRRASRLLLDARRPRLHAASLFVANSKPWACIA